MELLEKIFALFLTAGTYLLPFILAHHRKHKNKRSILLLTIVSGWTIIGWLIAFKWSLSSNTEEVSAPEGDTFDINNISTYKNFQIDTPEKKIVIFVIGLCSAMFLTFALIGAPHNANRLPDGLKDESALASVMCQDFTRDKLKSPSSAKFPMTASKARYLGAQKYILSSHVDSQNSYGAMIRTKFNCIVYRNLENNNWELMQLRIE